MPAVDLIKTASVRPELKAAFPGPLLEVCLAEHARLAQAGYGPAVPRSFLQIAPRVAAAVGPEKAVDLARDASRIAIRARPRNAALYLETAANIVAGLSAQEFDEWRELHLGLLKTAPEAVQPLLETATKLLARLSVQTLAAFVRTGLLLTATKPDARSAFFRLETPDARREFARHAGDAGFRDLEPSLRVFYTALWGKVPFLREAAEDARQASFSEMQIRFPASYQGYHGREVEIARATVAHVGAHQMFGGARFALGQLKPMHVAVISLIEDARVETLAMREMPGLSRLWLPFHTCAPGGVATAPSLFARLARALIDPDFPVEHGWVAKGLRIFEEHRDRLEDTTMARRIGNLLANDLGQTRVQFNFRDYTVQPIYRDDNLGLWDLPDDVHEPPETEAAAPSEGRRSEVTETPQPRKGQAADVEEIVAPQSSFREDPKGTMIERLPEYDRAARLERPDWVTANAYEPVLGDPLYLDGVRQRHGRTLSQLKAMISEAELGRTRRLKRQAEGDRLDLDAAIDAAISFRARQDPDHRVYEGSAFSERSVAVHLLLDTSKSTGDLAGDGASVLDMERDATAILAEAMDQLGDRLAITGFSSNGRDDLRLVPIKSFDEKLGIMTGMTLSGLSPGYSTRMGAALRHAGRSLAKVSRHHRLVLILTDGEPSDIDVPEREYLRDDAKRAVQNLRAKGVLTHCVALGPDRGERHDEIFGAHGYVRVPNLKALPAKLSAIYMGMTS